jgi:hypothetical protein
MARIDSDYLCDLSRGEPTEGLLGFRREKLYAMRMQFSGKLTRVIPHQFVDLAVRHLPLLQCSSHASLHEHG